MVSGSGKGVDRAIAEFDLGYAMWPVFEAQRAHHVVKAGTGHLEAWLAGELRIPGAVIEVPVGLRS